MPEHDHYDEHDLFNAETHHESTDVPIRPLWWAIGIFIVFGIVTHIVLGLFYKGLVIAERNRMDPPETAIARPADAGVPQNQPLLQPFPRVDDDGVAIPPQAATPVVDMITMRAHEEKVLNHYAWVDREQGVVRIPIEEAKSLLAARIAIEAQTTATGSTTTTAAPGSDVSPAGSAVSPDTGAVPPATTGTAAAPTSENPTAAGTTAGGTQ